jgi:hypothetical protein
VASATGRTEVAHDAPEATDPEVEEVPGEGLSDLRGVAQRTRLPGELVLVPPLDERPEVIGRHPDPRGVEGGPLLVKGVPAVEGLPLAALVVHLAGEDRGQPVEGERRQGEDGSPTEHLADPGGSPGEQPLARPGQEGIQAQGGGHEDVRGLDVAGDAGGGREVGRGKAEGR